LETAKGFPITFAHRPDEAAGCTRGSSYRQSGKRFAAQTHEGCGGEATDRVDEAQRTWRGIGSMQLAPQRRVSKPA